MKKRFAAIVSSFVVLIAGGAIVLYMNLSAGNSKPKVHDVVSSRQGRNIQTDDTTDDTAAPPILNWDSFNGLVKFGITFIYPGNPYVLDANVATDSAHVIITKNRNFRITIQANRTDHLTLDEWLSEKIDEDAPDYRSNYGFILALAKANSGLIASTSVDGAPAIVETFDCAKYDESPATAHHTEVTTLRKGILYLFTAADICLANPEDVLVFDRILRTIKFVE